MSSSINSLLTPTNNITLTWDMLYHPTLLSIYKYLHDITFILSTQLSILAMFIILKKSTEQMGFYKWILFNSLIWNYLFELIYFLYRPVFLLPSMTFYSNGVANNTSPNYFVWWLSGFLVAIYGSMHSFGVAYLYRIVAIFPGTRMHQIIHNPKLVIILLIASLGVIEFFILGRLY